MTAAPLVCCCKLRPETPDVDSDAQWLCCWEAGGSVGEGGAWSDMGKRVEAALRIHRSGPKRW